MNRSKTDAIIDLFEQSEEENQQLKKSNQRGVSIKDNLKKRQHKHRTCLSELTRNISIAPGKNRASRPTGKWELGYWIDQS